VFGLNDYRILVLLIVPLLINCGGGGGGGALVISSSAVRTSEFEQPVRAGTFNLFTSGSSTSPVQDIFVQDLNNDAIEEIVIAGRMSQSATELVTAPNQAAKNAAWENSEIVVYGFNGSGVFENQTSTWFAGADNQIIGTEPVVDFGDFDGNGTVDMAVGHTTDMELFGPLQVFKNTGANAFVRETHDLGDLWMHDLIVHDINQDGFDDIFPTTYTNTSSVLLGGAGGFTILNDNNVIPNPSAIAAGDFLGDGSVTFIMADATPCGACAPIDDRSDTLLLSFTQTDADTATMGVLATLPDPIFETAAFDALFAPGVERSHDIRAIPFDFDRDNLLDVLIISVSTNPLDGVNRSEVQFLKNNGAANFTDVTSSVRVGWDNVTNGDYNPQLVDVNDDGLTDILFSAQNSNGDINSRVLLQTSEGKYLQSYASTFANFFTATSRLESNQFSTIDSKTMRFLQGPGGDKFLVTTIHLADGQQAVYTAKLGNLGGSTAQASVAVLQQIWPYITINTAQQAILRTALTDFSGFNPEIHGVGIIDLERAKLPIGELRIPLNRASVSAVPISGNLNGVNLTGIATVAAFDELGRDFQLDLSPMSHSFHDFPWFKLDARQEGLSKLQYSFPSMNHIGPINFSVDEESRNMTLGISSVGVTKNLLVSGQYTKLERRHPFLYFDGMWGTINSSDSYELITSWRHNDFWVHGALMQTQTNMNPGLIRGVSPIVSSWGEITYSLPTLKLGLGVTPYILDGDVELNIPTSVEFDGQINYTSRVVTVRNLPTAYARAQYRQSLSDSLSIMYKARASEAGDLNAFVNLDFGF